MLKFNMFKSNKVNSLFIILYINIIGIRSKEEKMRWILLNGKTLLSFKVFGIVVISLFYYFSIISPVYPEVIDYDYPS
jgi:hypothetical protein